MRKGMTLAGLVPFVVVSLAIGLVIALAGFANVAYTTAAKDTAIERSLVKCLPGDNVLLVVAKSQDLVETINEYAEAHQLEVVSPPKWDESFPLDNGRHTYWVAVKKAGSPTTRPAG